MNGKRPPAVVFSAAYQLVLACVWLAQLGNVRGPVPFLLVASLAVSHLWAALGLYNLCEWGRQRVLQLSMFDALSVLPMLLGGHLRPIGALLQLGMPLYCLHALNDPAIRRRFS